MLGGLGLAEIAYCAGASSSEIGTVLSGTGTSDFPQFMRIPAEDCRSILFSTWQDLEQMVKTCQLGQLPRGADCYELVSQLRPIQLANLINSIELTPPIVSEAAIQEWARISVEFQRSTYLLFNLFDQTLLPGLSLVTGIPIPSSMPLEESLELLLQLPLPREVQSRYATQILYQTQPLIDVYKTLFEILPSNPEILYIEKEIPVNPGPQSGESIEDLRARIMRTMCIAMRFQRLRNRIRKGIKRQRGV